MNRRHQQQQRGLLLTAMLARIDGLERRLAAAERRAAGAELRVDEISRALAKAWRRIEELDRPGVRLARPMPEPARLNRRVPASEAAEAIGCDPSTVRRWIEGGRLRGSALDVGSGRKRWVVEAADLERLLSGAAAPAAPAAPEGDFPGASRVRNGG